MNDKRFTIQANSCSVVIEKDGKKFSIEKTLDNDIWFGANCDKLEMDISFYDGGFQEMDVYGIFYDLMKSIIGRYVLNNNQGVFMLLPEDFIDLENKIVTWHTDGSGNSTLKLQYSTESIKISIEKELNDVSVNRVRIRTSGSSYEYYYQEFTNFFNELHKYGLNVTERVIQPIRQESKGNRLIKIINRRINNKRD